MRKLPFAAALRAWQREISATTNRYAMAFGNCESMLARATGHTMPGRAQLSYEAKRIWNRLEIHHTPKHGSWLNMAEIELSVLNHHGLSERIASVEKMRSEISAWQKRRNKQKCKITWSFGIENAREKMKNIYPRLQS